MEFLKSIDATTWSVVAGGLSVIALVCFLKITKYLLKVALIAAVAAGIIYRLYDAGIIKLP